jgi:alpha-D-xyloside xylohydrolase
LSTFSTQHGTLEWRGSGQEVLRVEAWGTDGARVRAGFDSIHDNPMSALLPPSTTAADTTVADGSARLRNGRLTVDVSSRGLVRFLYDDDELLAEQPRDLGTYGPRLLSPHGDGRYRIEQRFRSYDGERLYGLGQHLHGRLDQKGCVVELAQSNAEVSIPFLISSRGYGLLWNNPALGRVELGYNATRWVADASRQIDYWVTASDSPAELMSRYADATGHPPMLPAWAAGLWQSRLRYRTQDELLAVAREYRRRGLPLSVIVADFLPLDPDGRLALRPRRMAGSGRDGGRAGRHGHQAHGVDLADGQPQQRELHGHAGARLSGEGR